jgi:hypothetical protein
MTLRTFKHVKDPSIVVSPGNNTIFPSYAKTEGNKTNIYLVNSTDDGQSFSPAIKVNNKNRDATSSPWTLTKMAIGPNNEIYLL